MKELAEYTNQIHLFMADAKMRCPSDRGTGGTLLTTYNMNGYAGNQNWWGYSRSVYIVRGRVRSPGSVYLASEGEAGATSGGYGFGKTAFSDYAAWLNDKSKSAVRIAGRHLTGANFLYFDGHVSYADFKRIPLFSNLEIGKGITDTMPGMN